MVDVVVAEANVIVEELSESLSEADALDPSSLLGDASSELVVLMTEPLVVILGRVVLASNAAPVAMLDTVVLSTVCDVVADAGSGACVSVSEPVSDAGLAVLEAGRVLV